MTLDDPLVADARRRRVVPVQVTAVRGPRHLRLPESLAAEEPLEMRVAGADGTVRLLGVTMRTPGNDFELAAGFVLSEGVVHDQQDIRAVRYCTDPEAQRYNVVTIDLAGPLPEEWAGRQFPISSACGVCGSSTVEDVAARSRPLGDGPRFARSALLALPERLREGQRVFAETGGLHGAALFDTEGGLLAVREDVGRHNAVDKLVGWAALDRRLPMGAHALVVSGRLGFEIVQKAAVAGIPVVVAVSAPSSLAVALARRLDMTVVAFVRGERANVYSGEYRVLLDA